MDDEQPPLVAPPPGDAAARSLVDDVKRLVEDGRTLAEAELAYQKSRAVVAGQGAKGVLGWGALALALLFFVLMALIVGLLLALSFASPLGPWGALGAVTLGLLAFGALSGWVAVRRVQRLSALLADQQARQDSAQ
jgi:hypothetical protein